MELDDLQARAVELCTTIDTQHRLVGVTGQAGTGKTTIIQQTHDLLKSAGHSVAVCAPTGKAAKRIFEATGIEASTIHRLLEYPRVGQVDETTGEPLIPGQPRRDRRNPLTQNVVIVDEAMMVNHELYRNLVAALPRGGVLRLFGDANQLPPIESSKRLQMMPSSFEVVLEKFPSITLTHVYRQEEGSGIIENGERILMGHMPRPTDDFVYKITDHPVEAFMNLIDELSLGDDPVEFNNTQNQVIVPTNKGWIGTHELNNLLQSWYIEEPTTPWVTCLRHPWENQVPVRVTTGDKVIYGKNDYHIGVMNGESGMVIDTTPLGDIVIDFGDRTEVLPAQVEYEDRKGNIKIYDPRLDLWLGYAITTHKSQGSEYRNVIYAMNSSRKFLLSRCNLYTAMTRARERVWVLTDQTALNLSMKVKRVLG